MHVHKKVPVRVVLLFALFVLWGANEGWSQTLSVEATPACGSTVTDTSVRPTFVKVLTPAPTQTTAVEYRWVKKSSKPNYWLRAQPINPSGRSVRTGFGTFAQLRAAYPGFMGFEYRLTDTPSELYQCFWTFDDAGTPPPAETPPPDETPPPGDPPPPNRGPPAGPPPRAVTPPENTPPTVTLSVAPNPVSEGSPATVTVRLSAALTSGVEIPVVLTAGTAETGDYGALASITVDADATTGTGTVTTLQDADTEDETFTVAFGRLPTTVTAGSPRSVQVTITDITPPMVSLSVAPNPVDEGEGVTVTAMLSAALTEAVTIPLTLTAGTAETGDYGALASITINAGSTTGTGVVTTAQDADTEDETFTVAFGRLPTTVTAGSPRSVQVTITDNTPPPMVSLSVAPNPVDEGRRVTVTAMLSAALTEAVTIPLTLTAGTAETGDYRALASITINARATTGTGVVTTAADADTEDETFIVAFGRLPSSVTAGSPNSVQVTITDNTPPPMVSLSVAPNPVDEGDGVTVTAMLSAALTEPVTIPLTLTAGTSETGDYGALASITINAGATTGTGVVTTAADADREDETFTVALGALPSSVTAGSPNSVQVTITDNTPPPMVSLSVAPNPVDEGDGVTVTAMLSATLTEAVTISADPDGRHRRDRRLPSACEHHDQRPRDDGHGRGDDGAGRGHGGRDVHRGVGRAAVNGDGGKPELGAGYDHRQHAAADGVAVGSAEPGR